MAQRLLARERNENSGIGNIALQSLEDEIMLMRLFDIQDPNRLLLESSRPQAVRENRPISRQGLPLECYDLPGEFMEAENDDSSGTLSSTDNLYRLLPEGTRKLFDEMLDESQRSLVGGNVVTNNVAGSDTLSRPDGGLRWSSRSSSANLRNSPSPLSLRRIQVHRENFENLLRQLTLDPPVRSMSSTFSPEEVASNDVAVPGTSNATSYASPKKMKSHGRLVDKKKVDKDVMPRPKHDKSPDNHGANSL